MLGIAPSGSQHSLVFGLFGSQLVEISVGFGVSGINFIQLFFRLDNIAQTGLDFFAYGFFRLKLRLLRQIADFNTGHGHGIAFNVAVNAGHNLEQG